MDVSDLLVIAQEGNVEEPSYENGGLVSMQYAPEMAEFVEDTESDFGQPDHHTQLSAEYGDPFMLTAKVEAESADGCPLALRTTVINAPWSELSYVPYKKKEQKTVPAVVSPVIKPGREPSEPSLAFQCRDWAAKREEASRLWWLQQDALWTRAGRVRP